MSSFAPLYIQGSPCHWQCRFCFPTQGLNRPGWESMSPDQLVHRFETYAERANGPLTLAFYGQGTLNQTLDVQTQLLSAIGAISKKGQITELRLSLRPGQAQSEILKRWIDIGLSRVELSVPTVERQALGWLGPSHSRDAVKQAIKILGELGLQVIAHCSPGMPGSSANGDLESAKWLSQQSIHGVRITPSLAIRHSHFHEALVRSIYQPLTLSQAVDLCESMVDLFNEKAITIYRMGWQPSDLRIAVEEIIAGPYHSSFRTMVEAARMYKRAIRMLQLRLPPGQSATLRVHPSEGSYLRGLQNVNLIKLRQRFRCRALEIADDPMVKVGTLVLDSNGQKLTLIDSQRFAS